MLLPEQQFIPFVVQQPALQNPMQFMEVQGNVAWLIPYPEMIPPYFGPGLTPVNVQPPLTSTVHAAVAAIQITNAAQAVQIGLLVRPLIPTNNLQFFQWPPQYMNFNR